MAQKKKSNWNSVQMLIVALLGAGLGVLATLYAKDLIEIITPVALTVLLTLFVVAVLLYFAITLYRDKIIRYLFGEDIQFDAALTEAQDIVKQTIIGTTEAIPGLPAAEKKRLQQAAPRVANYLIWSQFRSQGLRLMIGFFVAVGGLATTMLLFNQNRLLEKQNDKIDMQMSLEESNRRSALADQVANILDKVDEELRDTFNTNHGTRHLSSQLIGRIASLSQALRPYKLLDGDSLTTDLSPERGQLLLALINSQLDTSTLLKIYAGATFAQADLRKTRFREVFMPGVDLRGSDLSEAFLVLADMQGAVLSGSKFVNATVLGIDFSNAQLENADFTGINAEHFNEYTQRWYEHTFNGFPRPLDTLLFNDFEDAILNYTSFRNANLLRFKFNRASLYRANFTESNLFGAQLSECNLSYSTFVGAILSAGNMSSSDLYRADLSKARLEAVNFNESYLDYAKFDTSIGLDIGQIENVNSLYNCIGDRDMLKEIELIKPDLFIRDDYRYIARDRINEFR